jgi:hypothetical protein
VKTGAFAFSEGTDKKQDKLRKQAAAIPFDCFYAHAGAFLLTARI